ncbi:hypothetical protein JG688_00008655 [Phytophthora aleatoria]|uniref:Uncharacterized protein n=1 Tax=Phytophthora aleatoria TaxID=2496075 RepID=A0A8J5IY40_9STRA|nr:hypothetical protein JG688_00008655 [Phytophthora aleatoria]
MTALNQGRKCMQDLDRFTESMGWTFRNLDDRGGTGLYDEIDISRTAFGNIVEIPNDFVAPTITASKSRTRHESSSNFSRIHCKRAAGPASSSSARIHPGDGQSSCDPQPPLQSRRWGHKASTKPAKPQTEPVDFVYDINVRRKLREQLDADRRNNLLKAKAQEAALRAENKWVFDKRDKSPPRRKPAWQPSSPSKRAPIHNSSSSKTRLRAGSAPNKRPSSSSSSRSSSTYHSQRHRSRAPSTDGTDDVEISIQDFERRLQTQWSLHVD